MAENLLILHPREGDSMPADVDALKVLLSRLGLIGEAFDFKGQQHYKPGEKFLQLITFLGCSPVVSLGEPGMTGDEFCHIAFSERYPGLQFLYGSNAKPPRCPSCGHRDEQWRSALQNWRNAGERYQWQCQKCAISTSFQNLNWRQCAGFCRFFIQIWGVFEGEAVPAEQLLRELENSTSSPWNYFYLNRPETI